MCALLARLSTRLRSATTALVLNTRQDKPANVTVSLADLGVLRGAGGAVKETEVWSGDVAELQPGAFYLDREPQRKHLAGPFFTEGTHTKNSPEEVQELMARLEHAAAAASGAEVPPMTPSTQATLS